MSMRSGGSGEIPVETVRVARAAFPKGSLAIRVRDELGVMFQDGDFAALFGVRGRPAWSPGRLALVLVLQFVEGLTDRQAAEAVRARIDWKYALGLELTDTGFDYSVLSEFRDRLVGADGGRELLDGVLSAARRHGLITAGASARTDSTHVLSAVREINQLELVTETLRAALNAAARVEPGWVGENARPDWFKHYATRAEESRFPKARVQRDQVYRRIGDDGTLLLRMAWADDAPPRLRSLPELEVLRQVWVQHFHLVDGEVARRGPKDRPPGATRLVSPYDTEARGGAKGEVRWDGYKVHVTESCDPDTVHLVTNVTTTVATVTDDRMAAVVHAGLAERDLLPGEHWVDTGYANAGAVVAARRDHGVVLHGPMRPTTAPHARTAYAQEAFAIDWDNQRVTCPSGVASTQWHQRRSRTGHPTVRVRFSPADCRSCPALRECVNSPRAERREISLRPREEYEALQHARALQQGDEWKARYKIRAGVEGTISQGVRACDLRRSRYRGMAKTSLQHQLTGAAINLIRIDAWLTGTLHARTRASHLTALRPAA
ncbi:IS1182 family transposase [Streptomyces sp. NPDC048301]|uniref:IS1182 family transposase n=1 Tax=Streptomyces sp. NPDC048301 TaxID=3155631 RepID=UPI003433534A